MTPTNEIREAFRPVDLFGNPVPLASIKGQQTYLMDTRPDPQPIESAKLAKLRAASVKDAPVLLSPFVLWGKKPGHGELWLKLLCGTYGECAGKNANARHNEGWVTCIRRAGDTPNA